MAPEKVITSLLDLEEASRLASEQGLCRIRLADGEAFILCRAQPGAGEETCFDVTDPDEIEVVLSCLRTDGKTYSPEEARAELERRWSALGKAE